MLRDGLWVFAAEYRVERTQRLATSRISVPFEDVIVTDVLVQGLGNLIPADRLTQQHVADDRVAIHFIDRLGASALDRLTGQALICRDINVAYASIRTSASRTP